MRVPSWLPLLLGLLSAIGPISTDMYLPAFPQIESSLGGAPGAAQITLATWFLGLAIGQITQGPLSDRFGRRRPLIAGMTIYTLASIGCALAPGLVSLSVFRLIAALGGSASMVITRAIVRDLADGQAAARLMSQLMLVMGAAPILAPTLGGIVLAFAGWQAIFWITSLYGLTSLLLVLFFLPETLPAALRLRQGIGGLVTSYGRIFRERGFLSHALLGGFAMFAMFAYLGGSPSVFEDIFHLSPAIYGALFGGCAAGFIIASQVNPRILPRFGAHRVLRVAVRTVLLATAALSIVAIARTTHWWMVSGPILVTMTCMGFTMPNAVVGALSRHAAHAGSASALMGTLQFALAAISGATVGLLADGTARPMALLMLLGAVGAVICDLYRPRPA
ncbi:MAG: multidrug effflux MFS transporter [Rhodospirillales bacterium]|nr:multidrug effflux MFS transporter [Rhodospirillales bacterium]MDE2200697.1 multidrug effflux MFS transporter [Rhodospirillales bacterium]MDE2576720.1 multidrug effflux MFS transporter [Rhodospirillales bacterium]